MIIAISILMALVCIINCFHIYCTISFIRTINKKVERHEQLLAYYRRK